MDMDDTALSQNGQDMDPAPGITQQLWRQLWACVARLDRELRETPAELCWQHAKELAPPPAFRRLNVAVTSEPPAEEKSATAVNLPVNAEQAASTKKIVAVELRDTPPVPVAVTETGSMAAEARSKVAVRSNEKDDFTTVSPETIPPEVIPSEVILPGVPGALAAETDWPQAIQQCQACNLGQETTRIREQAIVGYPQQRLKEPQVVRLLLVCDVPTYDADRQGQPLPAESQEYLEKWLDAIQMRDHYYLTNLVKCRTPGNRAAWPEEVKTCSTHLRQQLRYFHPRAILALGSSAARSLSQLRSDLNTLRKSDLQYRGANRSIPLFVTYSVAEVLQNPAELRVPVWQDLKRLRAFLQS